MRTFRDFWLVYCLVADLLFFCWAGIFGMKFEGSDSSLVYKIFMTLSGSVVIGYTLLQVLRRNVHMGVSAWVLLFFLPLLFAVDYFWETSVKMIDIGKLNPFVLMMVCFSYTGICSGVCIAQRGIGHYARWLDVVMLIITVSLFISILGALAGIVSVGGASYQTLAYLGGFSFCINLCMILWGDNYRRLPLFRSRLWRRLAFVLLAVQLVACLVSGGRGGFVTLAIGSMYMLWRSRHLGKTVILSALCVLAVAAVTSVDDESVLMRTLEKNSVRTFDYIDSDKESFKRKTGREGVYKTALEKFVGTGYMGEGLCQGIVSGYPHNVVLEILMQGGLLYMMVWTMVFLKLFRHIHYLNANDGAWILYPLIFYHFIMLIFSGTYLTAPLFWFVISYAYCRMDILSAAHPDGVA